MQTAPKPANEALRLAALDSFDLLYTPAEERFDRITRIAANALCAPIALISLVGEHQQWFKSRFGLALNQTPRGISFCAHAILQERPLVITDARQDRRFCDNPLVSGSPYIRFYAGIPLRLADGLMAGALSVIDTVPRRLSPSELAVLADLACMAENALRQDGNKLALHSESCLMAHGRRSALLDPLTGCWNRAGFQALLQIEVDHARLYDEAFALIMLVIDDVGAALSGQGPAWADRLLAETASRLRRVLRSSGAVTRIAEDGFALVVSPCDPASLSRVEQRVRTAIQGNPYVLEAGRVLGLRVGIGGAMVDRPGYDAAQALLDADCRMQLARRATMPGAYASLSKPGAGRGPAGD